MGDHLDGSSIYDGINLPQFHYYEVQKVGPAFDNDMLMNIGKNWYEEDIDKSQNTFQNKEGALNVRVTDLSIS